MAYGSTKVTEEMNMSNPGMSKRKMLSIGSLVAVLLVGTVAVSMLNTRPEILAVKGAEALKYDRSITLKNVYNEYLVANPDGSVRGAAFWGQNHQFKMINAKGGKGAVKYGDKVSLMGSNGKYLMTTYSGKVTCRATVIAADTSFKIVGGSGPVMLNDVIQLKSEYGYLHAQPGGATATDRHPNTLAKFTVGIPGQEDGLREARGIKYGDVVKFKNKDGSYLVLNKNGWFEMIGNGAGHMENVVILSQQQREGHVSYGDLIAMRGHNGRFVTAAMDGHLEAVSTDILELGVWQIYGTVGSSSGYIHSRDQVVLKGGLGFVGSTSSPDGEHVRADASDQSQAVWQITKVWENTL
jgi:hypothetical protein